MENHNHNIEKTKKQVLKVRVRFAPSPTGLLHIGAARTALFNYIFSRKYKGVFVLRIEDSDFKRSKLKYENDILSSLKWLGIEWDEGPDIEGKYSPYKQSKRLDIYQKYIQQLLKQGNAYYCFCSKEETEAQRQYQISIGQAPRYIGKCRELPEKIVKQYLSQKRKSVIRFKIAPKTIIFNDIVRGKLKFDTSLIGDVVIAKNSSSVPFYNFANVIDDFEMKITHIIRGEEHISNVPIQMLIQEALRFSQPKYVHLPLVLAPNRSKLSKREGAISIREHKEDGYLPEALINFLAFLGWNPGTEREIFSKNSLIKEFSLEKIQKGGAIFNIKKLDYLNGVYIRQKSIEKLTELCLPYLIKAGFITPQLKSVESYPPEKTIREVTTYYLMPHIKKVVSFNYLKSIIGLEQKRMKKLSEICLLVDFFFKDELEYDKELLRWKDMSDREIIKVLKRLEKILFRIKLQDFNKETLRKILILEAEKQDSFALRKKWLNKKICFFGFLIKKPDYSTTKQEALTRDKGRLLWPLRVALSGKQASPGPFEIAEILGKEKTLKRIRQAYNLF